eukprot:440625-Lingulodinium_polyedra.AAC.1
MFFLPRRYVIGIASISHLSAAGSSMAQMALPFISSSVSIASGFAMVHPVVGFCRVVLFRDLSGTCG